jgi:hypothetical protein
MCVLAVAGVALVKQQVINHMELHKARGDLEDLAVYPNPVETPAPLRVMDWDMAEKFINGDHENTKQQQMTTMGDREEEEEDEDEDDSGQEDEDNLSMEDNVDFIRENNVDLAREDNDVAVVNEYEETPEAYLQRLAKEHQLRNSHTSSSEKNRERVAARNKTFRSMLLNSALLSVC